MTTPATERAADLGELFSALRDELLRQARGAGASTADAEDAVGDAFLHFARRARSDWPENPRAYLHAVVRNDVRRRAAAAREVPTPQHELDRPAEDDDELESLERTALVARAFASLSPREQRLLEGATVQRLSLDRLGAEFGLSLTATTTAVARARASLRTAYLSADLEPRLAACGMAPDHLARAVLGSASERMRTRVERHASGCATCAEILGERRRPSIGRSALIVSLSLLGGGVLPAREPIAPARAAGRDGATRPPPGARGGLGAAGVAGPVALVVAVVLGVAGAMTTPPAAGPAEALTISPSSVTLAPYGRTLLTVRNDGELPVEVALQVSPVEAGALPIDVLFQPASAPTVPMVSNGGPLSIPLGEIGPSASTEVVVTAPRAPTEADSRQVLRLQPVRLR